jgi:hypothetical protein
MLALAALLVASPLAFAAPPFRCNGARSETLVERQSAIPANPDMWVDPYESYVDSSGGVNCYSAPTYNSDKVCRFKSESSVAIGCQTHGEEVNGNDVWDYTIGKCYVPNDRLEINHVWIPGMAECDTK